MITGAFPSSAAVYMLPEYVLAHQTDIVVGGTVQFVFPSLAHNVFFNATPAGAPADIPGEVSNRPYRARSTRRAHSATTARSIPG